MTISEKLQKINEVKGDIREAVNAKGVELSEEAPFAQYPAVISKIPQSVINMIEAPEGMWSIAVGVNNASMGSAEGVAVVSDGAMVVVKATPADAGYALEGWYEEIDGEEALQSADLEYKFQVDRDRMLLAKFGDAYLNGRDWFTSTVSGALTSSTSSTLYGDPAYGDGIFFVPSPSSGSSNGWVKSHDGVTWEAFSVSVNGGSVSTYRGGYSFVAFDGTDFICVSSGGRIASYNAQEDLVTGLVNNTSETIRDFIYVKETGLYLLSANTHIYTATSPEAWTTANILDNVIGNIMSIAYGNGVYLMVTSRGYLYSSSDGLEWHRQIGTGLVITSSSVYKKIAYGDGAFVILGETSTGYKNVFRSVDNGDTWVDVSYRASIYNSRLVYGNGVFVITYAISSSGTNFNVAFSVDAGLTWTEHSSALGGSHYGLGYGNGTFVTSGNGQAQWYYSRSRGPALP